MNYQGGKVHIWTCDMCPAITFEYWEQEDAENIAAELKARSNSENEYPKRIDDIVFGTVFFTGKVRRLRHGDYYLIGSTVVYNNQSYSPTKEYPIYSKSAVLETRRTNEADKVDEVYNKALWKSAKKQL